ncbi:TPA: serine protease [Kluyvera georgiana]
MHQNTANATFQVCCDTSCGSGFSFMRDDVVVTNLHVVANFIDQQTMRPLGIPILITEAGQQLQAHIRHVDGENDYAILQLISPLPDGRCILQPSSTFNRLRGTQLIFAGYPHGIPQLLTNEAILSAPLEHDRFALDGMVNGGNSGGPIVDRDSGEVVGIVTQRRFLLRNEAESFNHEIQAFRSVIAHQQQFGGVAYGNIDFGQVMDLLGRSLQITSCMLSQNANSGIGIGFSIQPVVEAVNGLSW